MIAPRPDPFLLREAAREDPDRPALVEASGRSWSYAALARRVATARARLRARGVRPGDPACRVTFPADVGVDALTVLYALVDLGVPVVPVHPKLTDPEQKAVRASLGATVVLGRDEVSALCEGPVQTSAEERPDVDVDPEAPLALIATSGTTGQPKGVVLTRRAFEAAAAASARNLGWRDDDRWLLCMPPAHVGGLSIPLRTLMARRTIVCGPPGPFEGAAVLDAIARQRVTLVSLVPTMLARLIEALEAEPERVVPSSLRAILLGGAGAPDALLHRARAWNLPVLTTYGLTETCGQVTTQRPGTPPDPREGAGHPLPPMEVRVVDDEICVRGPALLRGYVSTEGPVAPPVTDDGFLRTGDAGWFDGEGRLHVAGRLDDRIVTGGENVDPLEVERVLEGVPGVRGACVFGVEDPTWGQVVAAAVVFDDGVASMDALRRVVHERLAAHRRPRLVAAVGGLEATASGKVDRRNLALRYRSELRPLFE